MSVIALVALCIQDMQYAAGFIFVCIEEVNTALPQHMENAAFSVHSIFILKLQHLWGSLGGLYLALPIKMNGQCY